MNTFQFKIQKNISKFSKFFSDNDWNKISVETVKQMTIFKIEVDHKRDYMPLFSVKAVDWTHQDKRFF